MLVLYVWIKAENCGTAELSWHTTGPLPMTGPCVGIKKGGSEWMDVFKAESGGIKCVP